MTKFAAFIMTYEREHILEGTIDKIFSQTLPPEKIVIVDNSAGENTCNLVKKINNPKVSYHKVGYNSGPAGAARAGLKILSEEGYDWIYWGDDDDPPVFENTFEVLLKTAQSSDKCGCVGVVGQFFNKKTGFIKRVPDEMLQSEGFLEVDNIAGGMFKIINGNMIRNAKIFPDEKLFFGLEELEFDIQIKNAGYTLLVDKSFYWKHRVHFNHTGKSKLKLKQKTKALLTREYYSSRNILYICFKHKMLFALLTVGLYIFLKQFLRVRQGFSVALTGFRISMLATYHFITGKMGYRKIAI